MHKKTNVQHHLPIVLLILTLPLILLWAMLSATAVHAQNSIIRNLSSQYNQSLVAPLADTYNANCTDGVGDVADLISDIDAANTNPGADIIVLSRGCTYTFTTANNYWYGPNALPAIASDITIEGNGARLVNTNATRLRFFYVGADPSSARTPGYHTPSAGLLTLHNLTLTGGIARGGNGTGGGAGMGGAIFNQGSLILEGVTLRNNTAIGGNAGAWYGGGGGGLGADATSYGGGGFGGVVIPAGSNGAVSSGGGGGFGSTDNATGIAGGGTPDGLGGRAFGYFQGSSGNGSGGGDGLNVNNTVGGNFGFGGSGFASASGSGGGVGGGGKTHTSSSGSAGGGGGFGGGGGGYGGFGGGGGEVYVVGGTSGFGGSPTLGGTGHGGGGAGMGGAIFNHGGVLTATNSTLTANTAQGGTSLQGGATSLGGAIFNLNGNINLVNSTLASNTVVAIGDAGGGAIYNLRYTLDATIPDAMVTLSNSILADSIGWMDLINYRPDNLVPASGGSANTGAATVTFATPNLVENQLNNGGILTNTVMPLIGIDPLLGSLGDYGGDTFTLPLIAPDSPAVDVGDNSVCPASDQRGVARPVNGICDLGAYEAPPHPILSLTQSVTPDTDVSHHGVVTYTLILRNSGDTDASTAILTDTLPAEVNFTQWITAPESGLIQNSNAFTWTGIIPANTVLTYSFQAENLLEYGSVTNQAFLSDADQRRTASATFQVQVIVLNGNDAGPGSLRQVIADTDPGGTVRFRGDTDIYLNSQLYIGKALNIEGGNHAITISGDSNNDGSRNTRVFNIAASDISINRVNIIHGTADNGGCIYINAGSSLILQNSTISDCIADDYGGGIYNAVNGPPNSGTLLLQNSTLLNNSAQYGGGFYNAYSAVATLQNSTMSGNLSSQIGDGFYNAGILTLENSTLSGNGAVYNGGTLHFQNTIIANGSCWGSGSIGINVNNLVEDSSGCGTPAISAPPLLNPLTDNGGATPTFSLLPNSPAIDAGDASSCPVADQRGEARDDLGCDIGAYELKYADSDTVIRPVNDAALTTFGPTLMGIMRDTGATDPGVITVTKSASWASQGPESIGAWWDITPTETSGFSLTMQLCFTSEELGSLSEGDLRFWRYHNATWNQVGDAPTFATVNGYHCATLSGVDELSVWTLATSVPTAVSLQSFSAVGNTGLVGLLLVMMMLVGITAVLRRRMK